jgi:hypothetical protein
MWVARVYGLLTEIGARHGMPGAELLATHLFRCYGTNAQGYVDRVARDLIDPDDVELVELWHSVTRIVANLVERNTSRRGNRGTCAG